jgi:DNA-binding NtrC family response regulator
MSKISGEAEPSLSSRRCDEQPGAPAALSDAGARPFAFVIDDEEAISRFIAATLEALGIETATFQQANPAIAAVRLRRPAIIFLDIALDQSDAIDVIKGLSTERYDGIVQLMSAAKPWLLAAIERMAERYALNVLPPLQKPVDVEMIRGAIASANLAPGAGR